jgi:hypothetical protein
VLAEGPQTPYEVFCHQCRVTFPVDARRCVHCGGRLSASRSPGGVPTRPAIEEVLQETELTRRGGFSPTTLVWIALLVSGALYRACAPGQG